MKPWPIVLGQNDFLPVGILVASSLSCSEELSVGSPHCRVLPHILLPQTLLVNIVRVKTASFAPRAVTQQVRWWLHICQNLPWSVPHVPTQASVRSPTKSSLFWGQDPCPHSLVLFTTLKTYLMRTVQTQCLTDGLIIKVIFILLSTSVVLRMSWLTETLDLNTACPSSLLFWTPKRLRCANQPHSSPKQLASLSQGLKRPVKLQVLY